MIDLRAIKGRVTTLGTFVLLMALRVVVKEMPVRVLH